MHVVPLLDQAECDRTRGLVHALRAHWTPRAPVPFFTLGAATYMDICGGDRHPYVVRARALNPVLTKHFGWLHARVTGALAALLDQPVAMAPKLALPGFHVLLAHPAFLQPVASVHLDLQYRQHDWWHLGPPDFDHPISFTLPVSLPAAGGGLRVWQQGLGEARRLDSAEMQALLNRQVPEYVPYAAGSLVIHDGHLVHQIAPAASLTVDDERITLQGHALRCGGRWYAYW